MFTFLCFKPVFLQVLFLYVHSGASRRVNVVRAFKEDEVKDASQEIVDNVTASATEFGDKLVAWWDASEEKPSIIATGFGGLLVLYFANTIVTAVDRLPLISTSFELIGIFFSGWTAYRFFLVDGEKDKIVGDLKGFASKVGLDL